MKEEPNKKGMTLNSNYARLHAVDMHLYLHNTLKGKYYLTKKPNPWSSVTLQTPRCQHQSALDILCLALSVHQNIIPLTT